MKKQSTFFDSIASFIFKLGFLLSILVILNALEFNIVINKERNSLLSTFGDTVESGYSLIKQVKKGF